MKAILLSNDEIERFDVESWDEASARLYAAECAKEVVHLYEKAQPNDKRPRRAIEAAIDYARMSTAEVPKIWIESSRRVLEQAAEEAMIAAIEAIQLNNKAAHYAAWSTAYASTLAGSATRNASSAIRAAQKATELMDKEVR
jgi:hypothetical protein